MIIYINIVRKVFIMRISIYSRKSKFTGKGESIENQIEMCMDYIHRNLDKVNDNDISIFEDEGFSGKSLNRPQFQKMMEIEKESPFDYLIVYRLDRISRNVGDFANLIEELNKYNTSFVCIKEQFDTSTPMGRAMMNIAAVFAQLERETIAERVKDNMYMLARTGRWLGGTTPLGFDSEKTTYIDDKGTTRKCFKLTENPSQIEIVKIIYDKYIEFRSMNKLETYLINNNIKTQRGCQFYVTTIREILTNPVYCVADELSFNYFNLQNCDIAATKGECNGEYGFIGYSKTESTSKNNAGRLDNPMSKWIIALGMHKGIIPSSQWINVQNILAENIDTKQKFKQSHNPMALLSGVVMCSCGSYMRPKYYRTNKKGVKPYAYMCELKERSKSQKCNCPNVNGIVLDKFVCDILMGYDMPDNIFNKFLNNLSKATLRDNTDDLIKKQENAKKQTQSEISSLLKNLTHDLNDTAIQYINKEIVFLNEKMTNIDIEIKRLTIIKQQNQLEENKFTSTRKSLEYFKNNFDTLSVENKRNIIRQNIQKVEWNGKEISVFIQDE